MFSTLQSKTNFRNFPARRKSIGNKHIVGALLFLINIINGTETCLDFRLHIIYTVYKTDTSDSVACRLDNVNASNTTKRAPQELFLEKGVPTEISSGWEILGICARLAN